MTLVKRSSYLVTLDNVIFYILALLGLCTVCLHCVSPSHVDNLVLKYYRGVLGLTLILALYDLIMSIRWLFTFIFLHPLSETKTYLAMISTDNNSGNIIIKAQSIPTSGQSDKISNSISGTPIKSRLPVKSQIYAALNANSSKLSLPNTSAYGMKKPLIFDIGCINSRYGYAGSKKPSKIFKTQHKINNFTDVSSYNILSNERIVNWNGMEEVWNYIFDEEKRNNGVSRTNRDSDNLLDNLISSSLEDQPLFLSWCPSYSSADADTVAELAFEKYNVPSLYLGINSVLSLYGSGKLTGCSFHSGDSISHSCCIQDGYAISETLTLSTRSGNTVTTYLNQSLLKYGISKDKVHGNMTDFIRGVKEKVCQCKNGNIESNNSSSGSSGVPLTLPDGTSISISEQDTKYCAEKLFQSFSVKITSARSTHDSYSADSDMKYKTARDEYDISIQQTILNSIERCPEEYRASQWKNISLSGGCTLLNGLRERLQNEIIASAADDVKINVSGVSNRDQTIWLGGSVLASNDDFRGHWISRDEYNSNGVSVIHQKCQTKLLRKNV